MQNKAVAEFYKSDFKRYEQFRQRLNELIGDVSSNNDDVIDIKDIAVLIPLFNKSILLYQMRQPSAALKILLVLLRHLDLVETTVAERIGLLAVNILLNLNQPRKAEAVIDLLVARMIAGTDFIDDDEGIDVALDKSKDTVRAAQPLNQFRWMFRLAKLRSKVMNQKYTLIPAEEVNISTWWFSNLNSFQKSYFIYFIVARNASAEGSPILRGSRLSNGREGIGQKIHIHATEFHVSAFVNPQHSTV